MIIAFFPVTHGLCTIDFPVGSCILSLSLEEDIAKIQKSIADARGPINDLISSSNVALADINQMKKALSEPAKDDKIKLGRRGKTGVQQPGASLFDIVPGCDGIVNMSNSSRRRGEVASLDLSKPCIISYSAEEHKAAVSKLSERYSSFKKDWDASPTLMRAEQPLSEEAATYLLSEVAEILPKSVVFKTPPGQDADLNQLAKSLGPVVYGIRKDQPPTLGTEKSALGTLRITHSGSRSLIATPLMNLVAWLNKTTGKDADLTAVVETRQRAKNLMTFWTQEGVTKYLADGNPLFHGTIGPTDALYLPGGFFFAERLNGPSDAFGFKAPVVAGDGASKMYFDAHFKAFQAAGKMRTDIGRTIKGFLTVHAIALANGGGDKPAERKEEQPPDEKNLGTVVPAASETAASDISAGSEGAPAGSEGALAGSEGAPAGSKAAMYGAKPKASAKK